MINFFPLEGQAQTQLINSRQMFGSYLQARRDAERYGARLAWEMRGSQEYLVSVSHGNGVRSRKSLGPRSPETEQIFEAHRARAEASKGRLLQLEAAYTTAVRVNRALAVGQAPSIIVAILDRIWEAGLTDKILVVGTNAIYSYAAQAGVHIAEDVVATQDLDLLWDSRSQMTLASPDPKGLLGVIQKADRTFLKDPDQIYTLTNSQGYQVDLIKRDEDREPGQLWESQDDFWAVKVRNMDWLLSAPRVKLPVFGANGAIALMHTVDPRAFALFKLWMSKQKDRDAIKARRDEQQARAMLLLLEEYLPIYPLESIHRLGALPQRLREDGARLIRQKP